ncbi:uncharacterized protein PGTG_09602 [Puccinia graminis f. sp. tritici CRL 75-36-700-3]|uniref:Uncharacterized protein n=1 Tax=Puccinia graminis f. sp. tritici (strain CRL 75-36-700-3 / race SCCL) TaxID=418459 RepID=E3KHW4_PUCGT|nr:uncharacterized protein PGTG_09602 [Puccinia graminis f. sp. tritici CRL 75-36-700-3]EFP83889.1 hypothetical protein PGTG_09602 [Puccinia graminis f. sp. tritici CRL 75-36-700-3]
MHVPGILIRAAPSSVWLSRETGVLLQSDRKLPAKQNIEQVSLKARLAFRPDFRPRLGLHPILGDGLLIVTCRDISSVPLVIPSIVRHPAGYCCHHQTRAVVLRLIYSGSASTQHLHVCLPSDNSDHDLSYPRQFDSYLSAFLPAVLIKRKPKDIVVQAATKQFLIWRSRARQITATKIKISLNIREEFAPSSSPWNLAGT